MNVSKSFFNTFSLATIKKGQRLENVWSSDVFFSLHRSQENQWQSISELNSFVVSVQVWTHEDHMSGADTRREGWLMHPIPSKLFWLIWGS